jgi:hypothetical protein
VKPSHYVAASVLAVLVSVAGVWVASPAPRRASGSALSQGHDGWLAARRYLEARGVSVSLLGDASTDPRGVLALVFPWQRFGPDLSLHRTRRHLARGGTVLFAYTPQVQDAEREVAATMGMGHQPAPDPPLHPLRWRAYAAATSSLLPEDADSGRAPLLVSASRARLTPPVHATILFRDESGRPASFSYAHGPGRVVVVPAAAFSNARIEQGGNADLLESLVLALGTDGRETTKAAAPSMVRPLPTLPHQGMVGKDQATTRLIAIMKQDIILARAGMTPCSRQARIGPPATG